MLAEGASGNGVPQDRPKASRLLAGAAAVLLVATAISCSSSGNGTPTAPCSGTPTSPGSIWTGHAVSIPTDQLDAYAQCMVNAGWQITAIRSTGPDEPPEYRFAAPSVTGQASYQELQDRSTHCETLRPTPRELTDDEIRGIYNRWVGQYQCLVGLGYQPDPPPSVEKFIVDWKGDGPWNPLAGVDFGTWTQTQLNEAKAKCTLDVLDY